MGALRHLVTRNRSTRRSYAPRDSSARASKDSGRARGRPRGMKRVLKKRCKATLWGEIINTVRDVSNVPLEDFFSHVSYVSMGREEKVSAKNTAIAWRALVYVIYF